MVYQLMAMSYQSFVPSFFFTYEISVLLYICIFKQCFSFKDCSVNTRLCWQSKHSYCVVEMGGIFFTLFFGQSEAQPSWVGGAGYTFSGFFFLENRFEQYSACLTLKVLSPPKSRSSYAPAVRPYVRYCESPHS